MLEKSQTILLSKLVKNPHITFEINPVNEFPEFLIGTKQTFVVDGIGKNETNQGFRVKEIPSSLQKYYQGAEVPHITLSLSEKGKAVNTKDLVFQSIVPFAVTGYMGVSNHYSVHS